MIAWNAIYGIVLRYLFLYGRNGIRFFELVFWPVNHLLIWGFVTRFLVESGTGDSGGALPISFLLGAVMLWDVWFRSSQGITMSFLEDIWTRNLLNIFVAPVRLGELVAGFCMVGLIRVLMTIPILIVISWLAFHYNIFQLNFWLPFFYANLLVFGWAIGMIGNSLVIRFGQAAESLTWALPFFLQPFSAVYYTVETMPAWMHPVAYSLPSTHVFEAMRGVMAGESRVAQGVGWALLLNVVWMSGAALILRAALQTARERGLLTKVATQ